MNNNQYVGICRYCGEEKTLIKAHILPKKFYKDYPTEKFLSVNVTDFSKKFMQSGCLDKQILCKDCDGILGTYDKEAYRILQNDLNAHKCEDKSAYIYLKNDYDYKKLRFFFISLLWRASITKKQEYSMVQLGEYENIALSIMKEETADRCDLFKTVVFREPDGNQYPSMVYVSKNKFYGETAYDFFFNQFRVSIKPTFKNIKNLLDPLERLYFNENEFVIIEDQRWFDDKRKFVCNIQS